MGTFRKTKHAAAEAVRKLDIDSVGTERNFKEALPRVEEFMREEYGLTLNELSVASAERYLAERAQEVGQKTLDRDRQAMEAVLDQKLPVVKSELEEALGSRAYTHEQAAAVAEAQSDKHSLSTVIAENTGMRAHELLTIRPATEQPRDTHREYRDDRFAGREDVVIYTVVGKGGLCREIALDRELADRLEERRLDAPVLVKDRDIFYKQHYDIGGGKQWSDSFSRASERALGWSTGAHGLRHEYAQERMNTLQSLGYAYRDALGVVSQEMGHFRPDITEVYLR